tara:strand:- start:160 stop:564 length:405 start_codon:yes stop_codon:yes gene_type:complete
MKKIITKITSFVLAFLVLFSTFSFTVDTHYCGDFIVDVSYTGEAEVCKTDMANDLSLNMKDCCSDEQQKIEGQDELQVSSHPKFDFKNQLFFTSFIISYQNIVFNKTIQKDFSKEDSPPDFHSNFQVLYQSFLI